MWDEPVCCCSLEKFTYVYYTPSGTLSASLDMTPLPQSPVDTEDSPPPPLPPKQFSAADTLQSPKLPEGKEPHQSEIDAPYPPPPKANQGDNILQSHPPNTHQQTAVSGHCLEISVQICSEYFPFAVPSPHNNKIMNP